ncbi:MAG TPA: hypothetical protein VIH35_03025 [Kiritimatiellia bacterium]
MVQRRGMPVVLLVGLVWLVAGAGDWFMRFHWFRWQQTFIVRPLKATEGPALPMQRREFGVTRGGDLTHLVGIPAAEREFEDERSPAVEWSDEFGFRNVPPTTNTHYPVVVAGASYMNSGHPMTNMFAARLASRGGVPVYCHAYPGRGPFYGLLRLLETPQFAEAPPKVLVWGVVEREVGGASFGGLIFQLRNLGRYSDVGGAHTVFDGRAFLPRRLKQSLPDTSAIAQLSRIAWNRARYALFGWLTPDVAISEGTVEGKRFLFYAPAVKALKWSPAERDIEHVVSAVAELNAYLVARDVTLLLVLIPDKEQVYRNLLPERLNSDASPVPPSCLPDFEAGLRAQGIRVVNMLGTYEAEAAQGVMLYYRDDTHWNERAIALAADRAWAEISGVLTEP